MANFKLYVPHDEYFQEYFSRVFQSSNVNFILGAGASNPAIMVAGDIESRIQSYYDAGNIIEAQKVEYTLLQNVHTCSSQLANHISVIPREQSIVIDAVLKDYSKFIEILESILRRRKNNLLAKRINIFSSNYDLFIESSALKHKGIILNDGFQTRSSITNEFVYDTRCFSRIFFESSSLYNYKVEIPVLNLIKLHGSMSWGIDESNPKEIKYRAPCSVISEIDQINNEDMRKQLDEYCLIYPKKEKFKTTVVNHTYYDLLRIYANELDKEQTTLIAFGFSFRDEHIFDLTKRALRNSTLKLIIFAFDIPSKESLGEVFSEHHNVDIIYPSESQQLKFEQFNYALACFTTLGNQNG